MFTNIISVTLFNEGSFAMTSTNLVNLMLQYITQQDLLVR